MSFYASLAMAPGKAGKMGSSPDKPNVPFLSPRGLKISPQLYMQRELAAMESRTAKLEETLAHLERSAGQLCWAYIKPNTSVSPSSTAFRSTIYTSHFEIGTVGLRAGSSYSMRSTQALVSLELYQEPEGCIGRESYREWDKQNLRKTIHGGGRLNIVTYTTTPTSTTSVKSSESGMSTPTCASISTTSNTDRKRAGREDDENPLDGNNGRSPKQTKKNPESENGNIQLACPYRKHNPVKYNIHSSRVCALNYWFSVSRIKEHIYRVHRAPIQCRRCGCKFPTEGELTSHSTAPMACELAFYPPIEGITHETERKLKSRKKSHQLQDKAEQWKAIYQILFPHESIPEPYFEPVQEEIFRAPNLVDLNDFDIFFRRVYPEILRDALRQHNISRSSDTWENDMVELVQNCHQELLSIYRSQHSIDATPITGSEPNTDLPMPGPQPLPRSWSETCLERPAQALVPQETDFNFDLESNHNHNTLSMSTSRQAVTESDHWDQTDWNTEILFFQAATEPEALP